MLSQTSEPSGRDPHSVFEPVEPHSATSNLYGSLDGSTTDQEMGLGPQEGEGESSTRRTPHRRGSQARGKSETCKLAWIYYK